MMRSLTIGIFGAVVLTFCPAIALADVERHALVVGNGNYDVAPLENPVRDAELMRDALVDVGFEVQMLPNADERDLGRALVEFRNRLKLAEDGAVAVFYYAGHAVQSNGENFLIPIDAEIEDEIDLDIHGISLNTVLETLQRSGANLKLVFLDACRNNPYASATRSATRGLAPIDHASGTLISYATEPGNVAVDGTGNNSPYTRSLARHIRQPGLLITQVLTRVRRDVMERTGRQQEPWMEGALESDFYFLEPEIQAGTDSDLDETDPSNTQRRDETSAAEVAFWQSISDSDNPESFDAYLEEYPEGRFKRLAQIRLRELTEEPEQEVVANDLPDSVETTTRTMEEDRDAGEIANNSELAPEIVAALDPATPDDVARTTEDIQGQVEVTPGAPTQDEVKGFIRSEQDGENGDMLVGGPKGDPDTLPAGRNETPGEDDLNPKRIGLDNGSLRRPALPEFTISDADERAYAQRTLPMRAGPGNEFDFIGDLASGQEVLISGYADQSDWVRIVPPEGGVAFVTRGLLGPQPPQNMSAGQNNKRSRQN